MAFSPYAPNVWDVLEAVSNLETVSTHSTKWYVQVHLIPLAPCVFVMSIESFVALFPVKSNLSSVDLCLPVKNKQKTTYNKI